MILLVSNRLDYETDYLVLKLKQRGADFIRLNTDDFPARASISWSPHEQDNCYFDVTGRLVTLAEIGSVWYYRPTDPVPRADIRGKAARDFAIDESRSAAYGALRTLNCLWVNHPDCTSAASYKIVQLQTALRIGFKVPKTLITNVPSNARSFLTSWQDPGIYKRLSSSIIRDRDGTKEILTSQVKAEHLQTLERVAYVPCLFQQSIEKARDVRVTVIGHKTFAVAIDSQSNPETRIDLRAVPLVHLPHAVIELPAEIEEKCRDFVSHFGLHFGAIDLIKTPDDEFYFLEVNPTGQWAWIEMVTGLPLASTIVDLLTQGQAGSGLAQSS